jgi:signal peptidase I
MAQRPLFQGNRVTYPVARSWNRTEKTLLFLAPFAITFTLLVIIFRAYWIPSGSMKPSLLVGDYVFANRLAYGFPALVCGLGYCDKDMGPLGREVKMGDVAVFRHPTTGFHFVKRIVGLPGDTIQMVDGNLVINGTKLNVSSDGLFSELYTIEEGYLACNNAPVALGEVCTKSQYLEILPNGKAHHILNLSNGLGGDDTDVFQVPEGHVFAIGDNRDNSNDSRFDVDSGGLGFVPLDRMIGRVDLIIFSLEGTKGRFMRWVQ